MELSTFLQDLFTQGDVMIETRIQPFSDEDDLAADALLRQRYERDILEMPFTAPSFDSTAARWGALYLYRSVQATVLRDLDDKTLANLLADYTGARTHAALYSADLCLRYLRDLTWLAKGLSPDDILLTYLQRIAQRWPLSTVGIAVAGDTDLDSLWADPALRQTYVDRVIRTRDKDALRQARVRDAVHASLGDYAATLWPDAELNATIPSSLHGDNA
jgi:hypothetical protein